MPVPPHQPPMGPSQNSPQAASLEHLDYLSMVVPGSFGWRLYEIPEEFPARYIVSTVPQRAPYWGVKKLPLYSTNLTPMMLYKVLRQMAGVGYVECIGLL